MTGRLTRRLLALVLVCATCASGCAPARHGMGERVKERSQEWEQLEAAKQPSSDPNPYTRKEVDEQRAKNEADFRAGNWR